jgi:hypothetical protein
MKSRLLTGDPSPLVIAIPWNSPLNLTVRQAVHHIQALADRGPAQFPPTSVTVAARASAATFAAMADNVDSG